MSLGQLPLDIIEQIADEYYIIPPAPFDDFYNMLFGNRDPLESARLSLINKNWHEAVKHSHIYSTTRLELNSMDDLESFKAWLSAPSRRDHTKGYVHISLSGNEVYKKLVRDEDALVNMSLHRFTLIYNGRREHIELPRDFKVSDLKVEHKNIPGGMALTGVLLPVSLNDYLTDLELIDFSLLNEMSDSRAKDVCLRSLKRFKWRQNEWALKNDEIETLELMPNLEVLDIDVTTCDAQYPVFHFPESMPKLKHLTMTRLRGAFKRTHFPSLEHLSCIGCKKINNFKDICDTLKSLEVEDTAFGDKHDIFSAEGLAQLNGLQSLRLWVRSLDDINRDRRHPYPSKFVVEFRNGYFDAALPNLETFDIAPALMAFESEPLVRFIKAHPKLRKLVVSPGLKRTLPPLDVEIVVSTEFEDGSDSENEEEDVEMSGEESYYEDESGDEWVDVDDDEIEDVDDNGDHVMNQ